MTRRVAVTGMGIVTSHGIGKAVTWRKTLAGRIRHPPHHAFRHHGLPDDAGGGVHRPSGRALAAIPARPGSDRASNLLYHAVAEALEESGLTAADWDASQSVVALGTTLGGMTSGERYHRTYVRQGSRAGPTIPGRGPPRARSAAPRNGGVLASAACRACSPNACASGANAVGYAFRAGAQRSGATWRSAGATIRCASSRSRVSTRSRR